MNTLRGYFTIETFELTQRLFIKHKFLIIVIYQHYSIFFSLKFDKKYTVLSNLPLARRLGDYRVHIFQRETTEQVSHKNECLVLSKVYVCRELLI